ncbi:MAG: amidohydrolase [Armatimonadetes bacterium]|nr:amidohydrolase [Armatimonadota bacterium]MDI9584760.1 amidohydrolase [Acidobacteriota bacterium]
MAPQLIIHNARIATCDGANSIVTAMAIWQDRIFAVGGDADILSLVGKGTRVIDLCGRFVCPGFTDCHVHLSGWAVLASGSEVHLDGLGSLEETLAKIAAHIPRVQPGTWLRGRGWDRNHWAGSPWPTASDLDTVTGPVPAALPSHDGHSVWANSAAMALAGIDRSTPDPDGGRINHLPNGEPSGIFEESAAWMMRGKVPEYTREELVAALRAALPQAAALGLTAVHNLEARNSRHAIQVLADQGALPLRITHYVAPESLDALAELAVRNGLGNDWVRFGGVKTFMDGALGSQTAAMLEPYEGSDNRGYTTQSPEELADLVRRANAGGIALALHAIGDRAIRLALDAFEQCAEYPLGKPRHRLEHAQHVHPDDWARMARLGLIASMQPAHMLADIPTCERQLGTRSRWAFAMRSLLDAGVTLAFGSDAPVEIIDPLRGFQSALLRQDWNGNPPGGWYPEQRLSAVEALRAYTIDAAWAGCAERTNGSLEPGKLADFVVVSRDLLRCRPEELPDARILATCVGGRPTHDPDGLFAG